MTIRFVTSKLSRLSGLGPRPGQYISLRKLSQPGLCRRSLPTG